MDPQGFTHLPLARYRYLHFTTLPDLLWSFRFNSVKKKGVALEGSHVVAWPVYFMGCINDGGLKRIGGKMKCRTGNTVNCVLSYSLTLDEGYWHVYGLGTYTCVSYIIHIFIICSQTV